MRTAHRYLLALILTAILCTVATEASAQLRPIRSSYALTAGESRLWSTYLSPLQYRGQCYALEGRWEKIFNHWDDHAVMHFDARLEYMRTLNPAGSARMIGADIMVDWGLAWRHEFLPGLVLTAGGALEIYGGALFLPRNGNNPVTAIAAPGLDLTASLSYRFRLGRLPVIVADRVKIPSLSIFFCPEYGESYYEIYLGNRDNLIHCGWWGNTPGVDQRLEAELLLGRTSLILGWRYELRQFDANDLHTRLTHNAASIGIRF